MVATIKYNQLRPHKKRKYKKERSSEVDLETNRQPERKGQFRIYTTWNTLSIILTRASKTTWTQGIGKVTTLDGYGGSPMAC